MSKARLDPTLLSKLAKRKARGLQSIRESIAHKASKEGISSEAALVLIANREGIGTAAYLRRLAPHIQDQVRALLREPDSTVRFVKSFQNAKRSSRKRFKPEKVLAEAARTLVEDKQLYDRCIDLLRAARNHDRVFREATTVLEDRIRKTAGLKGMTGGPLVGRAINPDPRKTIIEVSPESGVQEGFHSLCKGIILWVRNATHHELRDDLSMADALKFCGFIDSVLNVLRHAKVHPGR